MSEGCNLNTVPVLQKVSLGFEMPVHCVKEVGFHLVFYFFRKKTERFLLLDAIWPYFTFWKVFGGQTRLRYSHMSSNPVCQSLQQLKRHHYLRVSLTDRCNLKCQLAASRCEAFQRQWILNWEGLHESNWNSYTRFAHAFCACESNISLAYLADSPFLASHGCISVAAWSPGMSQS